jgi:DNA (cytosine-5)-methyltransferase 1
MLRVLDIFSGIGGFSLGLERTGGFKTVAFCEIDPFCRKVLAKHWPDVPCYEDVRTLTASALSRDGIGSVDVICGGFPCQDVSVAQGSSRAGLDGERSGLWHEYARLVRELRPRFVIVENVPGLLSLGIGDVLRDLAACGYDAEWQVISAAAVGAPHIRDRVWLVSYPNGDVQPAFAVDDEVAGLPRLAADRNDRGQRPVFQQVGELGRSFAANAGGVGGWGTEPGVDRMAHGVPHRVDRLRSLGNAVVPQIPEMIGRAILQAA